MSSEAPPPPADDFGSGVILEEETEKEPIENALVFGCLPLYAGGYFVCFLQLVEAVVLILCLIAAHGHEGSSDFFAAVEIHNEHNPIRGLLHGVLYTVIAGDVIFAMLALGSLWLCANKLPIQMRSWWPWQAWLATHGIAAIAFWRLAVTILTAPFVGCMLAYEPEGFSNGVAITITVLYLFLNLYVLWALLLLYRLAVEFSVPMQEDMQRLLHTSRAKMMEQARQGGITEWKDEHDPRIFGTVPLEQAELLFLLASVGLGLFCLIHCIFSSSTIGAWAFFVPHPQVVRDLRGFEIIAYVFMLLAGISGVIAILLHQAARDREMYGAPLDGDPEEPAMTKKRCTSGMLICMFLNILRFAMFIPITGMTFIMSDICGLYLHGLSHLEDNVSPGSNQLGAAPLHCSGSDLLAIFLVPAVAILDAYFLVGLMNLYSYYRLLNGQGEKPSIDSLVQSASATFSKFPKGRFPKVPMPAAAAEAFAGAMADYGRRPANSAIPTSYSTLAVPQTVG